VLVLKGAEIFAHERKTQLGWYDDVEEMRPKKAPSSDTDLVTIFDQYSQVTGRRGWQAEFLLGCSLLSCRYARRKIKHLNERGCKAFARCVISLLNSLFDKMGAEAFKVIPAMSGEW
jgi:hypothetical protein